MTSRIGIRYRPMIQGNAFAGSGDSFVRILGFGSGQSDDFCSLEGYQNGYHQSDDDQSAIGEQIIKDSCHGVGDDVLAAQISAVAPQSHPDAEGQQDEEDDGDDLDHR